MTAIHGTVDLVTGNREDLFSAEVRSRLCDVVCAQCGLLCHTFTDWEQHVAEVTATEDPDHDNLLSVQLSSHREKITPESFRESSFRKWPCEECGRFFGTEAERDSHRLNVTTSVQLVCPQPDCGLVVTDMEDHLLSHRDDVTCGECGHSVSHIDSHMVEAHGGHPSVLTLVTSSCAGDGTTAVNRKISLKTSARFLASEVKPVIDVSSSVNPLAKSPSKSSRHTDRDRALRPPDTLPKHFFDSDGKRIWAKMPSSSHTCELCGFKAVTKNKYREKQDHMSKWHYSKRLEMIIPQNTKKPFLCPDCHYTGKDRQCVLRHYTGKHNVLEIWTNQFLAAINTKALTPSLMYLVENVNFNAEAGSGEKFEISKLHKPTTLKQTKILKCILCKAQTTFASRKGLALHVELAHGRCRDSESDNLQRDTKRGAKLEGKKTGLTVIKKVKLHGENEEKEASLELREIQDSGLVCVLCENQQEKIDPVDDGEEYDEDDVIPMQSIDELNEHVRSVHSSLIIMSSFVLVRNTSAGPDRSVFTYYLCTNCGRTFPQSNRERLEVHVRLECQHSNNNQTQSVKSDIIASIKRSNENLAKLLTEISPSITIIPKPSTSPLYGDDFDDEDSMRKYSHQKVAKKDPCPCDFCRDPRFEEVKLHKCYLDPNCHKTFSKVTHLKAHIRCHKNERPFECDWPKCGKSFVRSDELRRHAWIHTREDRFKCPCGRGYSRADHFRAHAVKCDKYCSKEDLEGLMDQS